MKNKGEKIDVILVWYICPGKNWTDDLVAFCTKFHYELIIDKTMELDLIIRAYTTDKNWIMDFLFELKDSDMHGSLEPRNTTTSLARELKGDAVRGLFGYIGTLATHKYLIYVQSQLTEQDQIILNSLLDKFPTIRRKSYKTRWNALVGIEKIACNLGKPFELGYPVYSYSSLPSTLSQVLRSFDRVSNEKAVEWAELNKNRMDIWIENMTSSAEAQRQLLILYPDNLDSTRHFMFNRLYDLIHAGIEPGSVKMGVEQVADMLTPPEPAAVPKPSRPAKQTKRAKPVPPVEPKTIFDEKVITEIVDFIEDNDMGDGVEQMKISRFFNLTMIDLTKLLTHAQDEVLIYTCSPGHWKVY